jgi:cysteine synthase A
MSWVPSPSTARHLFYGILIGFSLSFASTSVISAYRKRRGDDATQRVDLRPIELRSDEILDGVTGLIGAWSSSRPVSLGLRLSWHLGNTPLVRINSLSDALGVEILGKAEVRMNR